MGIDPDQILEDRNRRRLLEELSPDVNVQRAFLRALQKWCSKRKL